LEGLCFIFDERCFANMRLVETRQNSKDFVGMTNFTFKFQRDLTAHRRNNKSDDTFLSSQITVGDPIVISEEENGNMAVVVGYVSDITPTLVIVDGDKRIKSYGQDIEEVVSGFQKHNGETDLLYRIDKDEFSSGMSLIRDNLVSLFSKSGARLNSLIVELEAPRFSTRVDVKQDVDLNSDQRDALNKVLSGMFSDSYKP
jgi:DNA replication ATP-dependent helicase Dna2